MKPMKTAHWFALAAVTLLFAGCTSAPLQLSADTYMISKTSSAGMFASQAGMQAKAIKAANKFAATKGKIAVARGSSWDRPAQGFPTFTYQFILVDKDDPRAKDVSLKPVADVTVEVTK
jgi:hypothetical protein